MNFYLSRVRLKQVSLFGDGKILPSVMPELKFVLSLFSDHMLSFDARIWKEYG